MTSVRSRIGLLILVGLCLIVVAIADGDQYCGQQNCYETLGIKRGASAKEIRRAYYKISMKLHPDKNKSPEAVPLFRAAATAYEVLSNAQTKADYDDMLDNPDNYYVHQMRYYRHRIKRVAASTVLFWLFALMTLGHYLYWKSRHRAVITEIMAQPQVASRLREMRRQRAIEKKKAKLAEQTNTDGSSSGSSSSGSNGSSSNGSSSSSSNGKGGNSNLPKPTEKGVKKGKTQDNDDVDDDDETEGKSESQLWNEAVNDIKTFVDIKGWQGRSPGITDLLPVYVFWFPYGLYDRISWLYHWVIEINLLKMKMNPYDREYATSTALDVSWDKWKLIPAEERAVVVARELWIERNMTEFRRERLAERRKYR